MISRVFGVDINLLQINFTLEKAFSGNLIIEQT
jgi:hypothetical protein